MNSTNPSEKQQSSINSNAKADKHPDKPQGEAASRSGQCSSHPCEKHNEISCNIKRDWIDKATITFEGFGLFVLIVYAVTTIGIYCANKKSADAAKSAADTADATLKNSQKFFEIDQRPYLVVDRKTPNTIGFLTTPVPKIPIYADLAYKNIGRTPASNICSQTELHQWDASVHTQAEFRSFIDATYAAMWRGCDAAQREAGQLKIRRDLAPNDTEFTTTKQKDVVIRLKDWQKLEIGTIAIYLFSTIGYKDAFNNNYRTEFCAYYFGTNPSVWHKCDTRNSIE